MAKIQDVDIPYLEFAEAAAPGTPASGIVRVYAKTDSLMYQKDDAGAETGLAGGGGSVATDAIWDAKGDLAGGTGANTATRLAVGTNGQVLTADSAETTGMKWAAASGGVASGTSFPGGPANNDLFYRTDLDLLFFYDGTRWLTVQRSQRTFINRLPLSATDTAAYLGAWNSAYDVWIETVELFHNTGATNTGSAFWTFDIVRGTDTGGSGASLGSHSTSAETAARWLDDVITINALYGTTSTNTWLIVSATKTGAASNVDWLHAEVTYRRVGT